MAGIIAPALERVPSKPLPAHHERIANSHSIALRRSRRHLAASGLEPNHVFHSEYGERR